MKCDLDEFLVYILSFNRNPTPTLTLQVLYIKDTEK